MRRLVPATSALAILLIAPVAARAGSLAEMGAAMTTHNAAAGTAVPSYKGAMSKAKGAAGKAGKAAKAGKAEGGSGGGWASAGKSGGGKGWTGASGSGWAKASGKTTDKSRRR